MKKKFTSRKFIAMMAGVSGGITLILTGNSFEGTLAIIASVITYICAEANIDAKTVGNILTNVAEKIEETDEKQDTTEKKEQSNE